MEQEFLARLLRLSLSVTSAERGMAVDISGSVCALIGLDEATVASPKFQRIAEKCLTDALNQDEAILTNNAITDPSEAPVTNTSFSDLRFVVAIPISGVGALYLDQPMRQGVISRSTLDRLMAFARQLIDTQSLELSQDELQKRFTASNLSS